MVAMGFSPWFVAHRPMRRVAAPEAENREELLPFITSPHGYLPLPVRSCHKAATTNVSAINKNPSAIISFKKLRVKFYFMELPACASATVAGAVSQPPPSDL